MTIKDNFVWRYAFAAGVVLPPAVVCFCSLWFGLDAWNKGRDTALVIGVVCVGFLVGEFVARRSKFSFLKLWGTVGWLFVWLGLVPAIKFFTGW